MTKKKCTIENIQLKNIILTHSICNLNKTPQNHSKGLVKIFTNIDVQTEDKTINELSQFELLVSTKFQGHDVENENKTSDNTIVFETDCTFRGEFIVLDGHEKRKEIEKLASSIAVPIFFQVKEHIDSLIAKMHLAGSILPISALIGKS